MADQSTWDARFLQLAETISRWSEDRDFHVGAVIVGADHEIRATIYNAARIGVPLRGCTIYINRFPCADCTRAIIQCGMDKIVCPEKPKYDGALDNSFDASEIMIHEAKILFRPDRT